MTSPTVWCPSCGDEYVAGSQFCSDCRVALVAERPTSLSPAAPEGDTGAGAGPPPGYAEIGAWPHLAAVMVVRRLRDAGIDVATLWSDPADADRAVLAVPAPQEEFADAVLRELPIDDELPRGSLDDYIDRVEARLAEIAVLLDELRDLPEMGGPGSMG